MYGPNFTNPINQSGQFMSEINRLNNHKEAKQMENAHQCEHCTAYRMPSADCKMKDRNTYMENQSAPFFPPPHQPKFSAESQEANFFPPPIPPIVSAMRDQDMALNKWVLAHSKGAYPPHQPKLNAGDWNEVNIAADSGKGMSAEEWGSSECMMEIDCLNAQKEITAMRDQDTALNEWVLAHGTGTPETPETIRGKILDTARVLTTGDRNKSYGPPIDNLTTYANLCTAYIFGKGGNENDLLALDAVDAAVLMVLAKVSRIAANRGHKDNYVDGAAYMAIAGECDELLGGT
jgi:hypothetical protein